MLIIYLSGLLLLPTPAAAESNPTPLYACDDVSEYPPYTYFDRKNGKPTDNVVGYTVDALKKIFKDRPVVVDLIPWNRCLQLTKTGTKYQIALGARKTAEREVDFMFTAPLFQMQSDYYYSRKKHPDGLDIHTLADLQKYKICGLFGYNYDQYGLPTSTVLTTYKFQQLIPLVLHDNCDLFIEYRQVIQGHRKIDDELRKAIDDPDLAHQPVPGVTDTAYYFIVPRSLPDAKALVDKLNNGFDDLGKSGEKSTLMKKYNLLN